MVSERASEQTFEAMMINSFVGEFLVCAEYEESGLRQLQATQTAAEVLYLIRYYQQLDENRKTI